MSVNSLGNFGVPGQNGQRGPMFQPILSHRFRVTFYNFGNPGDTAPYDITRAVKSVARPTATFSENTLYSYNSIIYIQARPEWEPIDISFYEDIDNTVMRRIQQQRSKQFNFFDQTSSRAGENYKFEMDIDVLAGGAGAGQSAQDPNVLQKYCLSGCHITGETLSELSYSETGETELGLTLRFDNCIIFDQDGNQMGTFDHSPEIDGKLGHQVTGIGGAT
ncbi:hypothetical protein CL653_03175 [bacterium]|nr:hypothetical protein [bacterium]|tara:strand:- start:1989 stop:2648 length:660 start_codon:yes stop_codon:yes gene_type:complete